MKKTNKNKLKISVLNTSSWWYYHLYVDDFKNNILREFPGGPVVRTRHFHCSGPGSIPGGETKIPQATWLKKNILHVQMPGGPRFSNDLLTQTE